jgi:two-component system, NtrC family, sensor histidine kinase KinB
MRISIHQKILLVFGGLLAIFTVIGVLTMSQIHQLGQAIDVILRENYRSVIACQEMKESLERIDSGVLFSFAGNQDVGSRFIEEYKAKFQSALKIELGNITLAGEGDMAKRIQDLFSRYIETIPQVIDNAAPMDQREKTYFTNLWPMFQDIKGLAQEILEINQKNMTDANDVARGLAASAHQRLLASMIFGWCVALLFTYMARFWILKPIHRLIESTNEIRRGNLDLVLKTSSSDEIGQLSESFNEMTAALRQVRKTDRINLMRTRRATEEVFKALPEAIAIIDLDGRIEFSTETADRHFGLKPGVIIYALGYDWLIQLVQKAQDEDRRAEFDGISGYIQQFIDNREYFFQPAAVPIPTGPKTAERTGTMLILKDVSLIHEQQELKQGVVSTVSHQLRTPLTSLRMSIHLLLEEKIGALNEKQTELLMAARDESERLVNILNDLLDLNRIESDKITLTMKPVSPHALARDGIEPFLYEAKDKGVTIVNGVSDDLPDILADPEKIVQVFANIISNALRFTQPGGMVTVSAKTEPDFVHFSIEDTGSGIAAKHLGQLFEPFYRIAEQDQKTGAGLGLAIVREIVRAHGGKVGVQSQVGKGSVFWFSLPMKNDFSMVHKEHSGEE